jgi:hypothetical protein
VIAITGSHRAIFFITVIATATGQDQATGGNHYDFFPMDSSVISDPPPHTGRRNRSGHARHKVSNSAQK